MQYVSSIRRICGGEIFTAVRLNVRHNGERILFLKDSPSSSPVSFIYRSTLSETESACPRNKSANRTQDARLRRKTATGISMDSPRSEFRFDDSLDQNDADRAECDRGRSTITKSSRCSTDRRKAVPNIVPLRHCLSDAGKYKRSRLKAGTFVGFWRRRRDSNPRYLTVQTLSKRPPSTTRPLLLMMAATKHFSSATIRDFILFPDFRQHSSGVFPINPFQDDLDFHLIAKRLPDSATYREQKKGLPFRRPCNTLWRREWDLNPREGF